jgi:hypothetical protein
LLGINLEAHDAMDGTGERYGANCPSSACEARELASSFKWTRAATRKAFEQTFDIRIRKLFASRSSQAAMILGYSRANSGHVSNGATRFD